MEKINVSFALDKEHEKTKEVTYNKLKNNKHVKAWLKKYKQDTSIVFNHTGKFQDWLTSVEKCDNCQGLAFCRQTIKGQYMDLYYDGIVEFGIHRCDFKKEYVNELSHGMQYIDPKISEEQLKIDLQKIDISGESNEYKEILEKIIDVILNENDHKGIYLWGKPGVGKSYLAAGITNRYAKKKVRCAFINVPTLINDLKMLFHDADASRIKLMQLKQVPILVLDDIGGEGVTAWSRDDILLPLLDYRMEHHKVTFFTSNYSFDDLKERYEVTNNKMREPMAAERVLERIRTLASEDFVKGESRRK